MTREGSAIAPTADFLSRVWPLDDVVLGRTQGPHATRATVSIRARQGRFIVKAYDDESALGLVHPSAVDVDQRLGIFGFLAGKGFSHAPTLLATRSSERAHRSDGNTAHVLEEIDGVVPPDTAATWAEFGRLAASVNAYTDYRQPYGIPISETITELTRAAARYPFGDEMLAVIANLGPLGGGRSGLVHGEISLANVVVADDGRLVLLDWDQAGNGPTVLEAGYHLITTFLTEDLRFRRSSATAFYRAYTGGEGMSVGDAERVFDAALLHAMRYLPFGDTPTRWARIRFALEHREDLLSVIAIPPEAGRLDGD